MAIAIELVVVLAKLLNIMSNPEPAQKKMSAKTNNPYIDCPRNLKIGSIQLVSVKIISAK
jgi:hypothetical protein